MEISSVQERDLDGRVFKGTSGIQTAKAASDDDDMMRRVDHSKKLTGAKIGIRCTGFAPFKQSHQT